MVVCYDIDRYHEDLHVSEVEEDRGVGDVPHEQGTEAKEAGDNGPKDDMSKD